MTDKQKQTTQEAEMVSKRELIWRLRMHSLGMYLIGNMPKDKILKVVSLWMNEK